MTVHKNRTLKTIKCINPNCSNTITYVWERELKNKRCTECTFHYYTRKRKAVQKEIQEMYRY